MSRPQSVFVRIGEDAGKHYRVTHLEQHEIDVGHLAAIHPGTFTACLGSNYTLRIAEELGQPGLLEVVCPLFGLRFLILVGELHRNWVMGVVDFGYEPIHQCQGNLVEMKDLISLFRCKTESRSQVLQNVGCLVKNQVAVTENWRRQHWWVGRARDGIIVVVAHDKLGCLLGASVLAAIGIWRSCSFEDEANELATAGQTRPVDELIGGAVRLRSLALRLRHLDRTF